MAVLELQGAKFDVELLQFWTDILRTEAKRQLPGHTVFTRENLGFQLAQMGLSLADCQADACEVELGRKLGASLVMSGAVLKIDDEMVASIKLHDTATGELLGGGRARGRRSADLEADLERAAAELFGPLGQARRRSSSWPTLDHEGKAFGARQGWSQEFETAHVVRFESKPDQAEVKVDGDYLCTTPCAKELTEGAHSVVIKRARYAPFQDVITVSEARTVQATLTPLFGWIHVKTSPPGLPLYLNGDRIGHSPLVDHPVDPGIHTLEVRDPRYLPKGIENFSITGDQRKSFDWSPIARTGLLKVSATNETGDAITVPVEIDGETVGKSPWQGPLIVGEYTISAGGRSERVKITEKDILSKTLEVSRAPKPAGPKRWLLEVAKIQGFVQEIETSAGGDDANSSTAEFIRLGWRLNAPATAGESSSATLPHSYRGIIGVGFGRQRFAHWSGNCLEYWFQYEVDGFSGTAALFGGEVSGNPGLLVQEGFGWEAGYEQPESIAGIRADASVHWGLFHSAEVIASAGFTGSQVSYEYQSPAASAPGFRVFHFGLALRYWP